MALPEMSMPPEPTYPEPVFAFPEIVIEPSNV